MIEAENITKKFIVRRKNPFAAGAAVEALKGVTFRVGAGAPAALVGRNGAGKTTLLKVLAGLILPDGGAARICGCDVAENPVEAKRAIGLVAGDERSLYWRLSGRENLALFGTLYDIPRAELKERVDEYIEKAGLSGFADAPVRTYSSGMKQRLALARALMHEPRALLMDEPNRSVDAPARAEFVARVRELTAGGGRSALLATHNLEEAAALGGRVLVLEGGRIVYSGDSPGPDGLREMMARFAGGKN